LWSLLLEIWPTYYFWLIRLLLIVCYVISIFIALSDWMIGFLIVCSVFWLLFYPVWLLRFFWIYCLLVWITYLDLLLCFALLYLCFVWSYRVLWFIFTCSLLRFWWCCLWLTLVCNLVEQVFFFGGGVCERVNIVFRVEISWNLRKSVDS